MLKFEKVMEIEFFGLNFYLFITNLDVEIYIFLFKLNLAKGQKIFFFLQKKRLKKYKFI